MKNIESTLTRLQLSAGEIKVYLALVEHGALPVSKLAVYSTLHRPAVYSATSKLLKAGLIQEKQVGKRSFYEVTDVAKLQSLTKSLQQDVDAVVGALKKRQSGDQKLTVEQLEGTAGIARAFMDVVESMKREDIFYRISTANDQAAVDAVVPKEYRPLRDQKKLERQVITSAYVSEQKQPRLERTIKYLAKDDELFDQNVIQFIYGHKVSLLDFNTMTAIIIMNPAIAAFQRKVFQTLYRRLPENQKK